MAQGVTKPRSGQNANAPSVWLGYVAARLGVFLVGVIPERLALASARVLARIALRLDRTHRALARRNLDLAYGEALDDAEKDRIVLESYQNLALDSVEFVHAVRRARRGEPPIEMEVEGIEHIARVAESGRAGIFVSCHMGNWEFAPIGTRLHGVRLHSIATPRKNPRLDRELIDMREALGQTIVWKQGAFREAAKLLRQGKSLGVLADQNQRKGGVFVDFFGVRASTTRGPAMLARRVGVPILPSVIRRVPGTNRHVLTVTEPIEPLRGGDAEQDLLRMTEAYTQRLESLIRETPGQWLWHHRRWRTRPWRETRMQRDLERIRTADAAGTHGLGPQLEPPVAPWDPMPAAIRSGRPSPAPLTRRAVPVEATPRLLKSLDLLRKSES